jgi:hypothetical protein
MNNIYFYRWDEAINHLVQFHGSRAERLLYTLLQGPDAYDLLDSALRDHNKEGDYNP